MEKVEISQKAIDDKFANAVDWFGAFLPNLISFYVLFTKRANNKIKSIRICVKTDITPVFEYNEQWVCEVESHMFNKILAIELYRFLLHHPTHRELHGPNAFIASTAVCNIKELDKFVDGAPQDVIDLVREILIDRQKVETMIGKKISDEDFYYEGIYELLNKREESQNQQQGQGNNSQQPQNSDGEEEQEGQSSEGEDNEQQENSQNGSNDKQKNQSQKQQNDSSDSENSDEDSQGEADEGDESEQDGEKNSGSGQCDSDEANSDNSQMRKNGGSGDDEESDSSDGDKDGSNDSQDGEEDESEGDSDGKGKGQQPKKSRPQQNDQQNFKDWANSGNENTEEWGPNSVVDEMIIDTLEHKCKPENWGDLTGNQIEEILLKNKRKVNIGPIISSFAASIRCRKRIATRMRYNKRYGIVYPGYRYDRKNKVLFAIDSSGSMSEEDIRKGCEILHNFLKKTQIDVAFWDAKMLDPFTYKRDIKKIEAPGRGGTDPSCIGDWLDEHHEHYDGVVIFTDCYWSWGKKNIDSEIFIISSEKEYKNRIPKFVKKHASIQELTHIFD